ncbi:2685_t:CDS:2 [Rhizophagus irregularis]|nr:2685_t:CDS:2 [Rhizophagus irregularis]
MANNERGGTIREYIDARKKGGMTWDEFRKLKSEVDGPQFSEYDLAKYRKKLDEEREAKLKGLESPTRSPVERRNFSEDEYYRSDEDDENYEKRNQHRTDEKVRGERAEKVVIKKKFFHSRKKICRPFLSS